MENENLVGGRTIALLALAGAAAAVAVYLWNRGGGVAGEESGADEVEAHPS